MNPSRSTVELATLAAVLLLFGTIYTGCKSHPKRVAHTTIGVLTDSVQAAVKGWSAHCRTRTDEAKQIAEEGDAAAASGNAIAARAMRVEALGILHQTSERRAKVDAAYAKYQAAATVAIDTARMDWNAPAPPDLSGLANEVLNLITTLTQTP